MLRKKSLVKIIIESVVGLIFTVLILVGANLLDVVIASKDYGQIVAFMNQYLYLILISSFVGFLAKAVGAFVFPINVASPPIHAVNSMIIMYVVIKFFALMGDMFDSNFLTKFANSDFIIVFYVLVFFAVLFFSSLGIMIDFARLKNKDEKEKNDKDKNKDKDKDKSE